jgi:hypothetical protein
VIVCPVDADQRHWRESAVRFIRGSPSQTGEFEMLDFLLLGLCLALFALSVGYAYVCERL